MRKMKQNKKIVNVFYAAQRLSNLNNNKVLN